MYSDNDGTASKDSEVAYWARIRSLTVLTSLLSWMGFGAALLSSEYTSMELNVYQPISWIKFLWASLPMQISIPKLTRHLASSFTA
jgi:hypothetical protein